MDLKEFFQHTLKEAPLEPTFQAAPTVKAADSVGADPAMAAAQPDALTQDVSAMSASSLSFFSKNVQSAVSKYNLEAEGFDASALQQFAAAIDELIFQMYQQVQEPATRQSFEADYQKLAADWSKDLTKLFDKVLKLKGHTSQY